jgi:hypothetical protein
LTHFSLFKFTYDMNSDHFSKLLSLRNPKSQIFIYSLFAVRVSIAFQLDAIHTIMFSLGTLKYLELSVLFIILILFNKNIIA